MATLQNRPKIPKVQFRVLIIGRANTGKTSILQRVCDTTESPEIYRLGPQGTRERVQLDPTIERGLHNIEDELVFSAHDGYVFHDSRGLESGSEDELKIVQNFVRRKAWERRLEDRLHAIWYCIPMDNDGPELELKYLRDICPNKDVPVIAVFTKYDQFRRNVEFELEDRRHDEELSQVSLNDEVEKVFDEKYLSNLPEPAPFVRLEKMHKPGQPCTDLIEMTANALGSGTIALMLLAKQKNDLKKSINQAVKWAVSDFTREPSTERIIKLCIAAFMSIWYLESQQREVQEESPPTKKEKKKKHFWKKLSLKKWMAFAVKKEAGKEEEVVTEAEEQDDFSREGLDDEEGERRVDELLDEFFEEEDFFFRSRSEANAIFSKLMPFLANPPLLVSTDDHLHRQLIGTVLILDQACLSYASSLKPTRDEALDRAYSQYRASDIHNEVMRQFSAPAKEYAILQFTEFILTHRLS